jgi:hypothetical protein
MRLEPFAQCCGMSGFVGFYGDTYLTEEDERKGISELENLMVMSHIPNAIAILNYDQHNHWSKHLPKYGWRLLTRVHNSVHNNILYLWLFEANPDFNPDNPMFDKRLEVNETKLDNAVTRRELTDGPNMHTFWTPPHPPKKSSPKKEK